MGKDLGFIRLGRMGVPMASRLIAAGYQLTVFDINKAAIDTPVAKGATVAASFFATGFIPLSLRPA